MKNKALRAAVAVCLASVMLACGSSAEAVDRWPSRPAAPWSMASDLPIDVILKHVRTMVEFIHWLFNAPVRLMPGAAVAKKFELMRLIDPCGLHDVAAAARVTGDEPDELMPGDSLADCQLRLRREQGTRSWRFAIRVGQSFPESRRDAAAAEYIDGKVFYREDHDRLETESRRCTYTWPVVVDFGISLTAYSPPQREGDHRPCAIAKRYLAMSAERWADVALRGENLTQPQLPLARLDPCAPAPAVFARLGWTGDTKPYGPYECLLWPGVGDGNSEAMIRYRFAPDPTQRAPASRGRTGTVAGRAATVLPVFGSLCQLTVAFDTQLAIQVDQTRAVQVIEVEAASCPQATQIAESVLTAIAPA